MTGATMMQGGGRRNGLRPVVWGGAAVLLLLPAVAMQFAGSGVNWTGSDFALLGAILAVACGLYELGAWLSGNTAFRAGFGLAVLAGFMTVWVNLAVGMLGDGPINLMFAGVLLVAALGAALARFRADGMVVAMVAAGVAQLACVGVGLWIGGFEAIELVLTAMFAAPWLLAALLFRKAVRDAAQAA
jgi:hypothetical protein